MGCKNYKEAFESMINGKAEALSADDAIIAGFIMDHPEFAMLPQRYSQDGYAIAFRKGVETESLINEVNMAINELRRKGYLNNLKKQWMPLFKSR